MSRTPDAFPFDGHNPFDTFNTQFIQFDKGKITKKIMHFFLFKNKQLRKIQPKKMKKNDFDAMSR